MDAAEATKTLVLRYFEAWQEPADFDELRRCLADHARFDVGHLVIEDGDALPALIAQSGSPLHGVTLIKSLFLPDQAVLFYDGYEKSTGRKIRFAEFIEVEDGLIANVTAAIAPMRRR
ncbi:MAG: nuclear transport factor 2 family protein [Anaerolineae bacterium]|nr:nuclear transport factor 2 family protein [Anaerolineae bacterium]